MYYLYISSISDTLNKKQLKTLLLSLHVIIYMIKKLSIYISWMRENSNAFGLFLSLYSLHVIIDMIKNYPYIYLSKGWLDVQKRAKKVQFFTPALKFNNSLIFIYFYTVYIYPIKKRKFGTKVAKKSQIYAPCLKFYIFVTFTPYIYVK